jgi:hypothetical protein
MMDPEDLEALVLEQQEEINRLNETLSTLIAWLQTQLGLGNCQALLDMLNGNEP